MGRHFLVRARTDEGGQHVRVTMWAGTIQQRTTGGRPNLGELCMTPDDWAAFRGLLTSGHANNLTIEDTTR